MISILDSGSVPQLLTQLHEWFELEWGVPDRPADEDALCGVPAPLVAVDDGHLLVGGIACTSHPKPDSQELGVWINALIVAPRFRGRGIASALVQAVEREAHRQGVLELFVYTDVPILYQKLGWSLVAQDNGNWVLTKPGTERRG